MSKSLRLVVPVVIFEAFIALGSVIPGQFQKSLTIGSRIDTVGRCLRNAFVTGVAEEVEVEFGILVPARLQLAGLRLADDGGIRKKL